MKGHPFRIGTNSEKWRASPGLSIAKVSYVGSTDVLSYCKVREAKIR